MTSGSKATGLPLSGTTGAAGSPRHYAQPIGSPGAKRALALLIGQICLLAGAIDAGYIIFFLGVGSPWLAWINVASIGMYALAYWCVQRHHLRPAVFLIWFEAFPHAIIGTLLLGWSSGFHYLLLMFVPAIIISSSRRNGIAFVLAMLAFLTALHWLSIHVGPLDPIAPAHLDLLNWSNFTLFVLMFSWTADYYRRQMSKAEARLKHLATTDALTGLANRRHFHERAATLLAQTRRSGSPCCIAVIDIDHFKSINDTHGHDVGDKVLIAIAGVLSSIIRDSDLLARWGGEEFVVLMPDTGLEGAMALAERLRRGVEATHIPYGEGSLTRTISLGVSPLAADAPVDAAISRADQALYRSKTEGRNRVTAAESARLPEATSG